MLFEGKTTIEVHLLTYLITEIPESDIFLALLEFDDTLDPNKRYQNFEKTLPTQIYRYSQKYRRSKLSRKNIIKIILE